MKQFFLEVNIFLLLCALSVLPAKAHQGAEDVGSTIFFYNYVDGGVEITYNSNTFNNLYSGTIEIPAKLAGKKVVAIGYNAFAGCSITDVTIPTGVKKIDARAFANCNKLGTLTLRTGEIPKMDATAFENTYLT